MGSRDHKVVEVGASVLKRVRGPPPSLGHLRRHLDALIGFLQQFTFRPIGLPAAFPTVLHTLISCLRVPSLVPTPHEKAPGDTGGQIGQKAHSYGTEAGGLEPPRVFSPPHFECGALPVRLRLRNIIQLGRGEVPSRGTGPLRLYRTQQSSLAHSGSNLPLSSGCKHVATPLVLLGAPGFEPGTSATRTQRSTGLSHAPSGPA